MRELKKIRFFVKKLFALAVFSAIISVSFAQPYNNSWINYAQKYYKFKIAETGIYRINASVLADAGIPLGNIDPANFQLFARGKELPIYIKGEGDGVFNDFDFIEFYGEYNDGWLDESLYGGAENHPNPYYSLFTDTISYYLTWNVLSTNNRTLLESDTNFGSYTPIDYVNKEVVEYYTIGNASGQPGKGYYDGETNGIGGTSLGYIPSEGWFDRWYTLGASSSKSIATKNSYALGANAILDAVVIGQSNYSSANPDQHLRLSVGANQKDIIFEGYQKVAAQLSLPVSSLGATNTTVNFESVNDLGSIVGK